MGLLTISGTVRAQQFWPGGRSDADTVTVDLAAKNPFVFENDAGKSKATAAFDDAEVRSQFGRNLVIKKPKSGGAGKITIRLQGTDAMEMHYQPTVTGAGGKGVVHPFRQLLGETCANALHGYVAALKLATIPCEVVTAVDAPSDVCDAFGRVVGNLVLLVGGARIDINHWLLREGWGLPGLYNSMSKDEIRAVLADYALATKGKRGIFSKNFVSDKLAPFDPNRRERKGPASFKPFSDSGRVNFPKFFRRQAEHHVRVAIGQPVPANLRAFIATKATDMALGTSQFLKLKGSTVGKKPRPEFKQLATFIVANSYPTGPELVFWENDSELFKAGTTTKIKTW